MIELYTKLSIMLMPGGSMSPIISTVGLHDSPQAVRVAANSAGPSEGQRWTPCLADMINKADLRLKVSLNFVS